MNTEKIFAELEGFAIYEPQLMQEYLYRHHRNDKNVLAYFTETQHGDNITQEGIVVPIIGVTADDYAFKILEKLPVNYKVISQGWVLQVVSGEIKVIGIGYLSDITMLTENKSLSFAVSNGWYHLIIVSYIDDVLGKTFGLNLIPTEERPIFKGNMATDYGF